MSIADALTQTFVNQSGWADPFTTEAYDTVCCNENRNGHNLQVRYDAVCRDYIGLVDGQQVGSFYGDYRQAYNTASGHITYLIQQSARYGQYKESPMHDDATPQTTAEALIDLQESLQVASEQKESAYRLSRETDEALAMVEAQVIKEINEAADAGGKKIYTNAQLRDAALAEWRMTDGYELVTNAQLTADNYRVARQNYDLALEHVKTYRALLEFERASMERDTEQSKAERARLNHETAKMNKDTFGIPF